jgi:hypothetical protein
MEFIIQKETKFSMDKIDQKVIKYFQECNIIKNNKIDSIINKSDYYADEAFFLFENFFEKFNIEKGYIDIDKFFNPLPKLNLKHFLNLFRLKKKQYIDKPKITIEHMIKVAKKKEWFDPT